jgi:hypothetical protein
MLLGRPSFYCPTLVFDPASLFAGTAGGFWDFTDPNAVFSDSARTTLATVGGQIQGVTDKSGNGRHLSGAATTILLGNTGGLNYGQWPTSGGPSLSVLAGTNSTVGGSAGWEGFAAFHPDNVTQQGNIFEMDALGSRVSQAILVAGTTVYGLTFNADGSFDPAGLSGGTMVAGGDYVAGVERSPTYLNLRLNKTQVATLAETKNPAQFSSGAIVFGAGYEGTSTPAYRFYTGRIYAALIISRLLTTAERDNLETWMYAHAHL